MDAGKQTICLNLNIEKLFYRYQNFTILSTKAIGALLLDLPFLNQCCSSIKMFCLFKLFINPVMDSNWTVYKVER